MALKPDSFAAQLPRDVFRQAFIAIAGFIISIRMFYPGLMSNDSVDQYSQALRFSFNDWHPPITAFIWGLLNDWIPGPLGMLLLFCAMYWGGLFLLSLSIPRVHKYCSIALLVLGFAPFAIGNLGAIWKDVFHAVVTLFAVGLLALTARDGTRKRRGAAITAALLLLLAAMARFNALAALPPLLWLLLGRPNPKNWKVLVLLLVLPFSVLLVSSSFNYGFLRAERSAVYSSLLIYDIGAITNATGVNAFGQSFGPEQDKKLTTKCYDTAAWDSYAWGTCGFLAPAARASGLWGSEALAGAWMAAIRNHPGEYARHRFAHWWRLLWNPQNFLQTEMQSNSWGFEFKKSVLHQALQRTTDIMQGGVFYKPGFWVLFSMALVALAARHGAGPLRDIVIALNVSGILYMLSYLPIGVATDFRYAYWSILATWFSLPLLWASLRRFKPAPPAGA